MAKGFFSKLLSGDDPDRENKEAIEANEFYRNHLCSGDDSAGEMGEFFRDTNTIGDLEQVNKDNEYEKKLVRFSSRRN